MEFLVNSITLIERGADTIIDVYVCVSVCISVFAVMVEVAMLCYLRDRFIRCETMFS